ncbi:MAG: hypothetical protein JSR09_10910 [Bacteroidetes bacterium]|nr:hypothetical protein [Bacteroidota bacterium]MBS1650201.1 hypothetical protein [Bacteroidota bacterium]
MIVTIGYLASALLALSLITVNAIRFRWLNLFGCFTFIVYGIFITAFPVILANVILLAINIFQIIKLYSAKESFEMLTVQPFDELVTKFLQFHKKDIQNYFPDYEINKTENYLAFMVLRNLSIANLFIASLKNGEAVVEINYTIPQYRDFKVGKFIFEKEREYLLSEGVKKIIYEKVFNANHENFIKVMGFTKENTNGICYSKSLESE